MNAHAARAAPSARRVCLRVPRGITPQDFEGMEAETRATFAGVAAQGSRRLPVSLPTEPAVVPAAFVSPAFFQVLGTRPVAGRLLTPADGASADAPVLVIAETLWRSSFGSEPDVIGQELLGGRSFSIVGVTPAGFPGCRLRHSPCQWSIRRCLPKLPRRRWCC